MLDTSTTSSTHASTTSSTRASTTSSTRVAKLSCLLTVGLLIVASCDDDEQLTAPAGCPTGQSDCDGKCVDLNTDRSHCGACGDTCDPGLICDGSGSCTLSCQAGLLDCGGTCVDPANDEAYCGASGDCQGSNAGVSCAGGEICNGTGQCATSCQQGLIDCGGTCIDPAISPTFCGASGDCQGATAGSVCGPGQSCVAGTCHDHRHWGVPQNIDNGDHSAAFAHVALDAAGNGMVVWRQSDGTRYNIVANRFDRATAGWKGQELIENSFDDGAAPRVALSPPGDGFAVWHETDGSRDSVWANRFDVSSGSWGTAQLIETDDAGDANYPEIAADDVGNAIAIWAQSDGTHTNLLANRYDASSASWTGAELLETTNGTSIFPKVTFDDAGNAFAIWSQHDGQQFSIHARRYDAAGDSWGTVVLLESDHGGQAVQASVAFDAAGNAIAVWAQDDGIRHNIYANRYDATAATWGSAELVETNNAGDAVGPEIAVHHSGNALAAWQQTDGTLYSIWANRYDATAGSWATPELIEHSSASQAYSARLGMSAAGDAIAIWKQEHSPRDHVWANRYNETTGSWGEAELVEAGGFADVHEHELAVDPAGNAIATWHQSSSTAVDIWVNRFD